MTLDSFSSYSATAEQRESIQNPEKQKCLSTAREIDFSLSRSRMFHGNNELSQEIRNMSQQATESGDMALLEHINSTLKTERDFTLQYLQSLTQSETGEMSAIMVQFTLQKAFIEKMVHRPERNATTDPDIIFREVMKTHQAFV